MVAGDRRRLLQARKEYAKATQWTQRYFKEGGNNPAMRSC